MDTSEKLIYIQCNYAKSIINISYLSLDTPHLLYFQIPTQHLSLHYLVLW